LKKIYNESAFYLIYSLILVGNYAISEYKSEFGVVRKVVGLSNQLLKTAQTLL